MQSPLATRALALTLGAVLFQALLLVAFAWPAARTAPRDVPLVVAGPAAQTGAVADRLARAHSGAFTIEKRPDEAAARQAIADRDAYGAIVVTPSGPRVLVASAASPVVAQLLTQAAQQLSGTPAAVPEDVVATASADPRGAGFAAIVLPLVMSGIAGALLLSLLLPSVGWRFAGVAGFAVAGGLVTTALAGSWMSLLPGPFLPIASVVALAIFAGTGTITGLASIVGRPGLGGGALLMLLGNPVSAAASAPELLPQPWGTIGQLLPAGALATLLRSVTFFDGAGAGRPLTVLLVWAAAGLALLTAATLRGRTRTAPAREPALA
ncbi:hypothetical protein ACRYCC_16210 [Actinomadura scrupuli]|uniref:hypothetical protein n=1 Tax=Actinomadura scrupuli TaxID=559629 RepID=UPI003D97E851